MHLDHIPGDRRVQQRDRVRRQLTELVDDLQRDVSPRVILGALVSTAKQLHLRLERGDPIVHRPRRGAVS